MERSVDDQWQLLANAVITKAVSDYRYALRGRGYGDTSPERIKSDCERFFRSVWFSQLSGVNGELILEKLKKEYEDECNACSGNA